MARNCFKPDHEELKLLIEGKYPGKVQFVKESERRITYRVHRSTILGLCTFLGEKVNFEHISSLCGVDWVTHMQVVYHISNYATGMLLELIVDVPNDDPHIASVAGVWGGANWHERETYELFGIIFDDHPNLKRLLTPDEYEFFPFKKSYKLRGQE